MHGAFDLLAMELVLLPWKAGRAAAIAGASQGGSQVSQYRLPVKVLQLLLALGNKRHDFGSYQRFVRTFKIGQNIFSS